jgi:hypothetical protein
MWAVVFSGDGGTSVTLAESNAAAVKYAFEVVSAEISEGCGIADDETREMFNEATTHEEREECLHTYFDYDDDWSLDIVEVDYNGDVVKEQ